MTIAGKVAPVPKGDYGISVAYEKLNVVRYNNNVYMAIKPNTGIEPTNEEYWMLLMEDVSQAQFDEIINGTTVAGKAKDADTVDGKHANEFLPRKNERVGYISFDEENHLHVTIDGAVFSIPFGWTRVSLTEKLNSLLPRDGSLSLTGNLLEFNNSYGAISSDNNHFGMKTRNVAGDDSNNRTLLVTNSKYRSDVNKALILRDRVDNLEKEYIVLHTGNFPVEEGTFDLTLADGTVVLKGVAYYKYGKLVVIQYRGSAEADVAVGSANKLYGLPFVMADTFNTVLYFTSDTGSFPINNATQQSTRFRFDTTTTFYIYDGDGIQKQQPCLLFGMYMAKE